MKDNKPKPDTELEWYDNEHAKPICDIVSEMLDNPNEYGIYPTSKCYKALNDYVRRVEAAAERRMAERVINDIPTNIICGDEVEEGEMEALKQRLRAKYLTSREDK